MQGFHHNDGTPAQGNWMRMVEFVTGKGRMQCLARGVVLLESGEVRTFTVRHPHNPDPNGNIAVLGDVLGHGSHAFEASVLGMREFEKAWVTDEIHRGSILADDKGK